MTGLPQPKPGDDRCAAYWSGDIKKTIAIDFARSNRLILATIRKDEDARDYLIDSLPDCWHCHTALIKDLAREAAGSMTDELGADEAIKRLEARLA